MRAACVRGCQVVRQTRWVGAQGGLGFVGRDAELRAVEGFLEQAIGSAGRLVVVAGEPGIGKTRLCEEASSLARERGAGVAWVACWEPGAVGSFWVWRDLLAQMGGSAVEPGAGGEPPDVARERFFDGVARVVRSASLERPWLLVVDDVQWADAGTLRLLLYLAPLLRTMPVLMVAALREGDRAAAPSSPLMAELVRHASIVRLHGLAAGDVGHLVGQVTGALPAAGVSAALRSATGGNPLFVAELAHRLHREGRLDRVTPGEELPVPPGVRVVLGLKLRDLDDACRRALAVAAVAGQVFSVDVVASVLGLDRVELLGIVDQAVRAGVIVPAGSSRYAWSHPLLRGVVYDDIGVAARVRFHEQVGDALEAALASGHDVELAAVSFHYLKAAAGGTAAKAVTYAERAAQQAMAALGYEQAARLYDRALEASRLDPAVADQGRLFLGAGAARSASGDTAGARQAFLGAADHARRTRRAVQLANAALGLSGAGFEVALFDEEQSRLLEEALGALGDREPALRSRLSARLAVTLSLAGEDARRVELSESAVDLAVQAGDGTARGAALAARCDARAGPEDIDRRTGDAAEIVRAARAAAEPGLELTGRRLRIVALAEAGDMPGFDAEVHEFAQVAGRLGQARYRWYVPLWRAARAASRGRLGEQGVLLAEAAALGRAAQSPNSGILVLVQRWFAWLEAGDLETAATMFEALMPEGAYAELGVQMVPVLVTHRAITGRAEEARAMLDRAAGDIRSACRDSEWLPMMADLADACFRIGGHELASWAYGALAPFGHRWAVEGIGAYLHGPVHRHLGLLAALQGRSADAVGHFGAALAAARRAGVDLLAARTLFDRGVALNEPDALRAALGAYRALGVGHRVAEIEGRLGASSAATAGAIGGADGNKWRRNGDVWAVAFAGRQTQIRDSKGMRDLARLLAQPGRPVAALDLAAPEGSPREGSLGEVIDAQARAAYRARLAELESELDAADAAGDIGRSARMQAERDALIEQLSAAYGLGGRARRTGGSAERARTAVTGRIRDAVRRLEAAHPELGRHLSRAVRTGAFCVYDPDPPARWDVTYR